MLQDMGIEDGNTNEETTASVEVASFERKLSAVEQVFQNGTKRHFPWKTSKPPNLASFSIIGERIQSLQQSLYYAGFDLQDTTLLTEIGREDQEALGELSILWAKRIGSCRKSFMRLIGD